MNKPLALAGREAEPAPSAPAPAVHVPGTLAVAVMLAMLARRARRSRPHHFTS